MPKPLQNIIKNYPKRGPLSQFRLDQSLTFNCFRCGNTKTSKLITIYDDDWEKRLCNGCYGYLLSIYEIKAGQTTVDEKSERLLSILIKLVNDDQIRERTKKINIQLNRTTILHPRSLRFLATSECVAGTLQEEANLEWSPAIIGLCKAFEFELLERFMNPLRDFCKSIRISEVDRKDPDFGKIASYCSGQQMKPPELGVVNYFISTAVNSKTRLEKSDFLKDGFRGFLNQFPGHNWIIDINGLCAGLSKLTSSYRNRAAHTDELSKKDYESCKELIIGENGIMWQLILSTKRKQKR